jgi:hypothetical protein
MRKEPVSLTHRLLNLSTAIPCGSTTLFWSTGKGLTHPRPMVVKLFAEPKTCAAFMPLVKVGSKRSTRQSKSSAA